MTVYDQTRIAAEIAALCAPAQSTTAQGKKLQDLVAWLFGGIPSVTVTHSNKHDAGNTEEKDLWVEHKPWASVLPFVDALVPIECKNEATKASAEEVTVFGAKIASSGGSDGVLVARSGLSGSALTSGHLAVRDQLAKGIRIVVLTADDLGEFPTRTSLSHASWRDTSSFVRRRRIGRSNEGRRVGGRSC